MENDGVERLKEDGEDIKIYKYVLEDIIGIKWVYKWLTPIHGCMDWQIQVILTQMVCFFF